MSESKDLIPLDNPDPGVLFAPGGLESILARIESEARAMVPDISTVKGRSAIASLAAKVAKAKTYLDGLGKDYTAELKRQTGAVDAQRKAMRDRLDALKVEVRRPLDEWEQAEIDRVDAIRARIAEFAYMPLEGFTSADHTRDLAAIDAIGIDDTFAEFQAEAQAAKEACLYRLTQARDAALYREAEAVRIAAEAEAARAKAQAEREERIAREAAERAAKEEQQRVEQERIRLSQAQAESERRIREADQRALEAAAKAQRDIALAKAREAAAIQLERDRAAAAAKAKADADAKRAADEAHRERIHAEIDLDVRIAVDGGDRTATEVSYIANDIVLAIIAGEIRHLSINY